MTIKRFATHEELTHLIEQIYTLNERILLLEEMINLPYFNYLEDKINHFEELIKELGNHE